MANQWLAHRSVLLEILDKVDNNDLDFRPWAKAMTLSELAMHIAGVSDMFITTARLGKFMPPEQKPEIHSVEDLRKTVKYLTDKNYADISGMSDMDLDSSVISNRIFTSPTPAKVWLAAMKEHEIHHKGQMFVYARMVGVEEMPSFVKRSLT